MNDVSGSYLASLGNPIRKANLTHTSDRFYFYEIHPDQFEGVTQNSSARQSD